MNDKNFRYAARQNSPKLLTLVEEKFENVALPNALKLHDFVAISSPWLKKIVRCGTSKCTEII